MHDLYTPRPVPTRFRRTNAFAALGLLAGSLAAQACPIALDIAAGVSGSRPEKLYSSFGNTLYFTARTQALGTELYKWTASGGVALLRDINPGAADGSPTEFTDCCLPTGPAMFFTAIDSSSGGELWRTDGTTAGTVRVKDIMPGRGGQVSDMVACDGRVFFVADDGNTGRELWVSDGTSAGTQLVFDIVPGSGSGWPARMTCCDGKLFFTAYRPATGRELWVSDGTPAGTVMLKDIYAGTRSPGITDLICLGGRVYFTAADPQFGQELWASDGTPAGTVLVKDIRANSGSSLPLHYVRIDDKIYFTAFGPVGGRELWVSDGTAAGTKLLKDVRPGPQSPNFRGLFAADGKLFFGAWNTTTGDELWVSDLTTAGTRLVKDIQPGGLSSTPQLFAAAGAGVFFHALGSAATGRELWFSDGSAAGTRMVCDLNPGPGNGNPGQPVICGGQLLFAATTPATGTELFKVPRPGAASQHLGEGGLPGRPTLAIEGNRQPVLGRTVTLVAAGPLNTRGFLVLGPSLVQPLPPLPGLMQGSCDFVAAFMPGSLILAATTQTSFKQAIQIPNQSALDGIGLNLQMFWAGAVPFLQASNGLQLAMGMAGPP